MSTNNPESLLDYVPFSVAAEVIGCTTSLLRQRRLDGMVKCLRHGGMWLMHRRDVVRIRNEDQTGRGRPRGGEKKSKRNR